MTKKLCIFAFDPGAANYALSLHTALDECRDLEASLWCGDAADSFLRKRAYSTHLTYRENQVSEVIRASSLVVLGTSERGIHEKNILHVSKDLGKQVLVYFDSSANLDERLDVIGCSPVLVPDVIAVVRDEDVDKLIRSRPYLPRVVSSGNPFLGSIFLRKPIGPRRCTGAVPRIGFLYEQLSGLNPSQFSLDETYKFKGTSGSVYRMHIAIEEFLGAYDKVRDSFSLTLRLHPKNELHEYEPYLKDFHSISQTGDVTEFLISCDLIFGCTSMAIVEAASLGIPTCSILLREVERNWIPTVDLGLTKPFYDRESLVKFAVGGTTALIAGYTNNERTRHKIVEENNVQRVLAEIMSTIFPKSCEQF